MTYNGVPIGRVAAVSADGNPVRALVRLDINPKYMDLLPANVQISIQATTVFGNKYVAFTSPEHPSPQRASSSTQLDVTAVTTEFNSLFETITAITEQVDPIKLNQTLSATAEALDRAGKCVRPVAGRRQRDPRRCEPRACPRCATTSPPWPISANAMRRPDPTCSTAWPTPLAVPPPSTPQRGHLDAALIAAIGFAGTGSDILERGGPYLQRGAQDLIPTSKLFDDYQGQLFCTIRNYHDVAPAFYGDVRRRQRIFVRQQRDPVEHRRGQRLRVSWTTLPRVNAKGGPRASPAAGSRSPRTCGLRRIW